MNCLKKSFGIFSCALIIKVFKNFTKIAPPCFIALRKYLRKNSYVDYNSIITSPLVPTVSVIAPAFNESTSIVDNIRTLLSLYYNKYEIIVINDGSNDNTLDKIIEAYELEKVNFYFDYRLSCQRVRGVYKSRNKSFNRLTIVDKVNGGKSDALNAGLNVSKNDLIVCVDADSIMEQDTLIKLVKPFLEDKDKVMIGAGGVIRIANNCEISGGKITKIKVPRRWLPRAQVLEYTRSFLLGRIAWSELDGLLVISGALGMFKREVVINAGGFSTKTVGEDMELVVRIRRYMAEQGIPYKVEYIPDPLCWTEVPSTLKSLARQRSRWTRGTIETLFTHRKLFLNKKYGKLGMLGYPYWLLFEWLAPIIEFIGILIFTTLLILGKLNVMFFLLLLGFVYFFAVSLSIYSVLFEEITFHKYEKRRDVLKLVLTVFLEPIFYHPAVLVMNIKGNIDKLLNKSAWGKQKREGFGMEPTRKRFSDLSLETLHTRRLAYSIAGAMLFSFALIWVLFLGKPGPLLRRDLSTSAGKEVVLIPEEKKENTSSLQAVNVPEEPASEARVTPVFTPDHTKNYYIIAGSFRSQENAERMLNKLRVQGFDPEIIQSDKTLARVVMFSSTSMQDARNMLEQIRIDPAMEKAWILGQE
ncbi:MAG: glycosyltransferase [Bacteroidales bacterium]|nr:glycosyltransferase [Bacteroidales bacterium]